MSVGALCHLMLCRLVGYTGGDTAVRGTRDSGSKQKTSSDDGVTVWRVTPERVNCRVRLTTFHGGNTA